jgi:5-(carboxyamino)imidazole ribonucleotide synthase
MKKVGIIGAGQLGQMLGFAAQGLGIECVFLDPSSDPPAAICGPVLRFPFDSEEGLQQLVAQTDLITYEFENVPVTATEAISRTTPVFPPPLALRHAQDRLAEKKLFEKLNIPVPAFRTVDSEADLRTACREIGFPVVLKTRRLGYDGKGQTIVRSEAGIGDALLEVGSDDLIAEQWIAFDMEVSAIGARSVSGETAFYALTHNQHQDGILSDSRAPAETNSLETEANDLLLRLLQDLEYVGVMALELFVTGDRLMANEFAPRVHNSGHWTIEGAETSQFENHLRAILDMPLGATGMLGYAGMLNLIGDVPSTMRALTLPGCKLHEYGKQARKGRKLGHVSVLSEHAAGRDAALQRLGKLLIS